MPLNSDFNTKPYWDDFNEDKNYYKVMFKPHVAVQARELNQIQTMLQNQIEKFGDNILREGTIVTGGNFVEERNLPYVKLQDLNSTETATIDVYQYVDCIAVGTVSGLKARVVTVEGGLEAQSPNTNTIWVKYLNTTQNAGGSDVKTFLDGEDIAIYDLTETTLIDTAVALLNAATGVGYGVRCGEGIIYKKGYFIRFADQLTIVSKYDSVPHQVVVGFEVDETLVNSYQDPSLLDNANSFNNYNAPGADRLKLTPVLTKKTLAEAQAAGNFFALQEYQNGRLIRRKLDTVYSVLGDIMARRRYEESGDYVVWGFDVGAEESDDANNITLTVSSGVGYINGFRTSLNDTYKVDVPQGIDYLTEVNQNVLINYGNYVVVNNMTGFIDFEKIDSVDLYDDIVANGGNMIGTALVRSVTTHDRDTNEYRIYLFDVKMNSGSKFSNVRSVVNGADGSADVVLNTYGNATIRDASFNRLVFPVGRSHIKTFNSNFTEYTYRTKTVNGVEQISLTGIIDIGLSGSDEFPYGPNATLSADQKDDIIVVVTNDNGDANYVTGQVVDLTNAAVTIDSTGKSMTIDLPVNPTVGPVDVVVYYNVMRTNVKPIGKFLTDYTITLDVNAGNIFGPWCLGMPDAYKLTSVKINGVDSTEQFTLNTGQRDSYYGLSYLVRNGATLVAGDQIEVELKAFTKSINAPYEQSFFDVDSYAALIASGDIAITDIPVYIAEDGSKISLRDAVDFRPYAQQTFAGTTATNPSDALSFASNTLYMGAPNSYVNVTYDFYVGRYDKIIMDQNGTISVINGVAAERPIRPPNPSEGIVLGTYYIPPYPSLPSLQANQLRLPQYAVRYNKQNNRRYTMADIRALDLRIQNLEYYTSLSLLENNTKDIMVLDENGVNRFKNGIFVDPFKDFRIADLNNSEFSAAIDQFDTVIEPRHKIIPLDLEVTNSSNVTDYGDVVALNNQEFEILNQPYATAVKSCTTRFYNYRGQLYLIPNDDTAPDVEIVPDINIDIDLATPFIEYTEAIWDIIMPQGGSNNGTFTGSSIETSVSGSRNRFNTGAQPGDTVTTITTDVDFSIDAFTNTVEVGDFVKDITIEPFIRSREVVVYAQGLRPNTTVYAYFDKKSIASNISPAEVSADVNLTAIQTTAEIENVVHRVGEFGDTLRTDANGNLFAIFLIPEGTFRVGDRQLEIFDVSSYNSIDALTTYTSATYSAFNFNLVKSNLTVSTRTPEFISNTTRDVNERRLPDPDPLIQSFIIDPNAADEAYTFITSVDLYFNSKSETQGITVSIREFEDGQPSDAFVGGSRVHVTPDNINISDDSSAVTKVSFNKPLPLRTNVEYGIHLEPDMVDPDYRVFICKVAAPGEESQTDLLTGTNVVQDTNSGMIFTSTNSRTWTPYQGENLKYVMYAAEFTENYGTVELTPKGQEFLILDSITGKFQPGERVFVDNSGASVGTISFEQANNIVLGANTLFQGELVSGDWLVGDNGSGDYMLLQVSENGIDSNTQIRTVNYPTSDSANTGVSWYKTTVGTASVYIVRDEIKKLVLRNSSAKNGSIFTAGATIRGLNSGASAVVGSVDDQKISFLQPNIRQLNFIETRTTMYGDMYDGVKTDRYHIPFGSTRYLKENEYYIPSKSNVVQGALPSKFEIELKNVSTRTPLLASPIVDHSISTILAYEYIVNNDYTDENTTNGNCLSKYVSKLATLADGMDAEDFKLFVTGYRPALTEIKAYIKTISISDGRNPYDIGWTEMRLKAETDYYSSSSDRNDYREYEFGLPTAASTNADTASFDGNNFQYIDTNGVVHDNFKYYMIKILLLSDTYSRAPRCDDIRGIALAQ